MVLIIYMKDQKICTRNHLSGVTDPALTSLHTTISGSSTREVLAVVLHTMCLV